MKHITTLLVFVFINLISFGQLVRGPYMTTPTATTINIQWRTSSATSSEVKYGTTLGSLISVASNGSSVTNHNITLTGLVPNTKYFYSIGSIGNVLQGNASNFFYTAPVNGSTVPTKFWVTGDFGNGSSGQINVRNSFTSYVGSSLINGWLWLGDNAYNNGTDSEYQTKVFDVYTSIFKYLPTFPALGNHDYAQAGYLSSASRGINFPYFSIFTLPTNGDREKYYSTNYGNIHFIALDSYGSYNAVGSPMYNWLQADLAANTQLWTVVYFHHPPYTKGSHDSDNQSSSGMWDMRNNIIPLLESYGVDVVLAGHSHVYERSYFIKGHFGISNTFNNSYKVQPGDGISVPYTKSTRTGPGTVYVVCGVGGQVGGTSSGYPHKAMYYSNSNTNGSLILSVSAGVLNCKFLTSEGQVPDQFTIVKTVTTLPIELVYFNAFKNDRGIIDINWSTSSETNNDYFTIERTVDFDNIESIATINGSGNSTTTLHYTATDDTPIIGTSYYRLKQTDYDGQYIYSDWVVINNVGIDNEITSNVYPNPIIADINIEYHNNNIDNTFILEIFNNVGSKVFNENRFISAHESGIWNISRSKFTYAPGVYHIKITSQAGNILYSNGVIIK